MPIIDHLKKINNPSVRTANGDFVKNFTNRACYPPLMSLKKTPAIAVSPYTDHSR